MVAVRLTPPRHWQDWCSWLLGIWLCLSPWALHFDLDTGSTRAAVVLGLLIIATEIVTLSAFRLWEEWVNVLLGAVLLALPWMLEIEPVGAVLNFFIVGAAVLALAFYEIWNARSR